MRGYKIYLNITDLVFCIRTEYQISVSDEFIPFLRRVEEGKCLKPTVMVNVQMVEHLLSEKYGDGRKILGFKVYEKDNGFFRYYYEPYRNEESYAVSYMETPQLVQIQYLHNGEKWLGSLMSCFSHMGFEETLLNNDRMIFHSACIETPYGGIVFTGPSGIGKSTQADLWHMLEGSTIINGDRTILYQKDKCWYGSGSPYAGSSNYYVNRQVPIRAVVSLEQADTCTIRRLNPIESFKKLYAGMVVNSWDSKYVSKICDMCQQFVEDVPVYHLACTPDMEAVKTLKKELEKEVIGCTKRKL